MSYLNMRKASYPEEIGPREGLDWVVFSLPPSVALQRVPRTIPREGTELIRQEGMYFQECASDRKCAVDGKILLTAAEKSEVCGGVSCQKGP